MRQGVLFIALLVLVAGCKPEKPDTNGSTSVHSMTGAAKPVGVRPFDMGKPDGLLMVTGGNAGLLEVCNCPGPMAGGLSRRGGLIKSYRSAYPNLALVDTGDSIWVEPANVRNEYVLRGYGMLGYNGIILGTHEWACDDARLQGMLKDANLIGLSSTVSAKGVAAKGELRFVWPGGKVAVVSDIREGALRFVGPERRKDLKLSPGDELAARIKGLREQGFIIVLAGLMSEEELADAAKAYSPDLMLWGHTQVTETKVLRVGNVPTVKVGGPEHVGAIAMKFIDGKLADLEFRTERVDEAWPIDGEMMRLYQAYCHEAMRLAMDGPRKEGLAYVGQQCGDCHEKQLEFWKKTQHGKAWATLVKVKRTGDPDCLMCHTSGFRTKNGFRTIADTPALANVNCQDCHRFNVSDHKKKGFKVPPVGKEVCGACHTHVTDPQFLYETRVKKIRCPSGKL